MSKEPDLTDNRYGRLLVKSKAERKDGRPTWLCKCDCGEEITVKEVYLKAEETQSCGCLKKEQDEENLRNQYNNKRVDGVAMQLFNEKPRKDSSTGYRGVQKYYTRKSKELRYRAWITVKGKPYYKSGFMTPEDAYNKGRLLLEKEHLPNNK